VLDVACGGGKYLLHLRGRGYRVTGIEPDLRTAERLEREQGLEVIAGTLPEAPVPDGVFDVVTFWWVLEHTHDPLENLRAARRALRPGGLVLVSVQNFASLERLIFGAYWHHLDLPGHLYHFEAGTLRTMLRHAGLAPVRTRQDLLEKDLLPSLAHRLGLKNGLDGPLAMLAGLPFDLVTFLARRSGLVTVYARRD